MVDIIEEWRPVVGYEGLYEVSNTGKVINIKTGHILKQHKDKDGYWVLSLKRDKYKNYFAHRLVAQAFIPNPNNLPQINHKDEDSTNNNVDNLEWCTCKYNINYNNLIERRSKKKCRKIDVFDINNNFIETVSSGIEASKKYKVSRGSISSCCNGNIKYVKNYIFKFH